MRPRNKELHVSFFLLDFLICYQYNSIVSFFRGTKSAGIAQSVEHFTRNEGVEGSSPFSSFCFFNMGRLCRRFRSRL